MARAVIGFAAGAVVWMPAFFALAILGNFVWSEYGTHAEVWFEQGAYTFPPAMSAFNALCWALVEVLAGWLAVAIGRRRRVAWVLAAVIASYLGLVHLILYWPNFPWWYNLAVALPAAPAVLVGGKLAGGFARPSVPIAAR